MLKREDFRVRVYDCDEENDKSIFEGHGKQYPDRKKFVLVRIEAYQSQFMDKPCIGKIEEFAEEAARRELWARIYYPIGMELAELQSLVMHNLAYNPGSDADLIRVRFEDLFHKLDAPRQDAMKLEPQPSNGAAQ